MTKKDLKHLRDYFISRDNYLFKDDFFGLSKQLVYFIFGMIMFQIFLGELMIFFELPQLTRLFHTWGSSWLVGIIIILYNTLQYEQFK